MFTRYPVVAALAIGLTIVACQPPAQEAGPLSDEDVAAIRATTDAFVQAALANDWAAAAEIYSEDVVLMLPGAPVMEGRATWQTWAASLNVTVTQYSAEIQEVDGRADLAFVRGKFSESLMFEAAPMGRAWQAYFGMFPDYWIRVEEAIESGDVVVLLGTAGGTYSVAGRLEAENRWETPAAWRALVRDDRVAGWRVYADNEPVRVAMGRVSHSG